MTVKGLRELLSKVPEGFTQEEFDGIDVVAFAENGDFETPCECQSGIIEFTIFNGTLKAFALLPHIEEVDPQLN